MFRRLLEFLGLKKAPKPNLHKAHGGSRLPMYDVDKRYSDMNRAEKRRYKRWLAAHEMWDGEVVIESMKNRATYFR